MDVSDFLDAWYMRVVALPLVSVGATALVRLRSLRTGGSFRLLEPEVFAVGLDLAVLTTFTTLTLLVDRARTATQLRGALSSARGADQDRVVSALNEQLGNAENGQVLMGLIFAFSLLLLYGMADWIHSRGYDLVTDPPSSGRRPSLHTWRGVWGPTFVGLAAFMIVLVLSR